MIGNWKRHRNQSFSHPRMWYTYESLYPDFRDRFRIDRVKTKGRIRFKVTDKSGRMAATYDVLIHAKHEVESLIKQESNPEVRVRHDITRAVEEEDFKHAFEMLLNFAISHVDQKFDEVNDRIDELRRDIRSI